MQLRSVRGLEEELGAYCVSPETTDVIGLRESLAAVSHSLRYGILSRPVESGSTALQVAASRNDVETIRCIFQAVTEAEWFELMETVDHEERATIQRALDDCSGVAGSLHRFQTDHDLEIHAAEEPGEHEGKTMDRFELRDAKERNMNMLARKLKELGDEIDQKNKEIEEYHASNADLHQSVQEIQAEIALLEDVQRRVMTKKRLPVPSCINEPAETKRRLR